MASILHIISGLGQGGAETMLAQLATRLHRRGHPQHVISLTGRGELTTSLEGAGIEVIDLPTKSSFDKVNSLLQLRRIGSRIAPDVVQGWMYHGNVAATASHLIAGRRGTSRLFWNLRASNMDAVRYRNIINWNKWLSPLADRIIVNSHAGVTFHKALGFSAQHFEVVPNGIDTDKFRPDALIRAAVRAEHNIRSDAVLVMHVARVDPMKDHALFLEAMRALPDVTAILVGAGTEGLSLPPNVRTFGARGDIERLYPAADIVVSSSAFGEGFSNSLAEGMSAGLVPVATDVGDARLIVGTAGRIVPPVDVVAFIANLKEIAALAPEKLSKLGLDARDRILNNFAIEKMVARYEELYLKNVSDI